VSTERKRMPPGWDLRGWNNCSAVDPDGVWHGGSPDWKPGKMGMTPTEAIALAWSIVDKRMAGGWE